MEISREVEAELIEIETMCKKEFMNHRLKIIIELVKKHDKEVKKKPELKARQRCIVRKRNQGT